MSDRKAIEARIAELKGELDHVEGRPAEVYSRIVGYYRSVRNWNAGKRSEYGERRAFAMPSAAESRSANASSGAIADLAPAGPSSGAAAAPAPVAPAAGQGMLVFTREACPNCSSVANYVIGSGLSATFVDVDREEGLELARRHGVLATPTVLGLDGQGRELFRALDLGQLKERLGPARA